MILPDLRPTIKKTRQTRYPSTRRRRLRRDESPRSGVGVDALFGRRVRLLFLFCFVCASAMSPYVVRAYRRRMFSCLHVSRRRAHLTVASRTLPADVRRAPRVSVVPHIIDVNERTETERSRRRGRLAATYARNACRHTTVSARRVHTYANA